MRGTHSTEQTGLIAWFASNPVAANLLLLMLVVAGVASAFTIRKQTTPDFELNSVTIRVPYLGAAPQEVEEGVVIKIEEAVQDIPGIDEIRSNSNEGLGSVTLTAGPDADVDELLREAKVRVDAISTFPALTERPVIYKNEVPIPVLFISLYGDLDDFARKTLAQQLRDALMTLPEVNNVENLGDRDYEISIEVSEQTLREYGLTMSEISEAIRATSVDLPGGAIKADGGDILLRTEGQVYTGRDFGELVLRTFPDGTRLTLADIADISDGFVEQDGYARFNGERTAILRILANGQQNELKTSAAVKKFIASRAENLPEGVYLDVWVDRARYLHDRLDMMLTNMAQGALLVFLVLTLFLRLKVAWWVIVGIPVTFCAALALMPAGPWPVTINMISLFAFILVLGIVVDDAIIIGESVYTQIRAEGHSVDNVITGTKRVAVAATFGVLTTIAAFTPMLFVGGIFSPFFEAMSVVVCLCLFFSLVESKLILPAHLAHAKIEPVDEEAIFSPYRDVHFLRWIPKFFQRTQRRFQHGLLAVIQRGYKPLLERAIRARGVTMCLFVAMLIMTGGLVAGGFARVVLFPEVPSDFIQVEMEMQSGTAPSVRNEVLATVEQAMLGFSETYKRNNPESIPPIAHVAVFTRGDTAGTIIAELPFDTSRPYDHVELTDIWRSRVGEIAGVKELSFSDGNNIGGGAPLSFSLTGPDLDQLEKAGNELQSRLGSYGGVFDINSSATSGAEEIRLRIKPEAEALGLTMSSLGRQVRQAFFGEEAQRIQRGKDELKVMVRYPREERRSVADLRNMRIRTPAGAEVPFETVAEIRFDKAYSTIRRLDRKRTVTVSADIDPLVIQPGEVISEIRDDYIPELLQGYPGVAFALQGSSQEEIEFIQNVQYASIAALFLIYALIAIPLKSYSQPLIIMSVIPFGLIGALLGHVVIGSAISIFSLFGIIALAGVVVNDSLIMVDFVNKARARGASARDAVVQSGVARFRAIILTSVTTAFGLMPMLAETSVQAQFVIPMAISLAFGILFATVITLFLIPCLYLWQLDVQRRLRQFKSFMLGREPAIGDV